MRRSSFHALSVALELAGGRGFNPAEVGNILSWRSIMKCFLRSLIQEGQLSVSGERICTILVNRLED